jgi:GAF domain-containing protein
MIDHSALFRAFQDYARALVASYDLGPMLYLLTDQVVETLDIDGAGLSMSHDGEALTFVTATDEDIAVIEQEQVAEGDGPCHLAFRAGTPVTIDDLVTEDRFGAYRAVALERGAKAVMGIPLPGAAPRMGALNLYRHERWGWSPEEIEVAQLLADMAAGYVRNVSELQRCRTLAAQLQQALDSRVVVEQAKGILIERHRLSTAEAFRRLREQARSTRTSLHAVAREVVEGTTEPWADRST